MEFLHLFLVISRGNEQWRRKMAVVSSAYVFFMHSFSQSEFLKPYLILISWIYPRLCLETMSQALIKALKHKYLIIILRLERGHVVGVG